MTTWDRDLGVILKGFVEAGEAVIIVYNGGSRPGRERAIIPVSVSADELRAREVGQRPIKTFKLERVASVRRLDGPAVVNPAVLPIVISAVPDSEHFADYLSLFERSASKPKWHCEVGSQSFSVHERFLNGNPKKTSFVSIQYVDRTSMISVDVASGELIEAKRELRKVCTTRGCTPA